MATHVCRVCFTSNVRMHRIDSIIGLQEMFEKVTGTKLNTHERPVTMCYICLPQLQKSYGFLKMCQTAEETFTNLIKNGFEVKNDSLGLLKLASIQHVSLSVAPTRVQTLKNDNLANESSQEAVKEELYEVEESANINYIVKDEMDEQNFQAEESMALINSTNDDAMNESTQEAVNEEIDEVEESANINYIVKDEIDEQHFTAEESMVSINSNNDDAMNESTQEAVNEEIDEVEESANINYIVKDEMDEQHFTAEESMVLINSNNDDAMNESVQLVVFEELDEVEESANINYIVKVEMNEQNFQAEESMVSINSNNADAMNESIQEAVKEKLDEVEESANINYIVKYEMDEHNFQAEESMVLINSNNDDAINESIQLVVNEEFEESANINHTVKDEMDEQNFQAEESIISINSNNDDSIYDSTQVAVKKDLNEGEESADVNLIIKDGKRLFSCNSCNKTFSRRDYFQRHMRKHTEEKPLSCNKCNKTFTRNSNLKQHMRAHTGEKPYSCNICAKTFSYSCIFYMHMKTHTGERPYSCNKCDKTYLCKSHLRVHMRIHTGENLYSCNICGKRFLHISALKLHMVTHTGVKPFSCNNCNKTFSCKSYLRVHMRIHTGDNPYSCNICAKTFPYSGALKLHMVTHTGVKPFSCKRCHKTFISNSHLEEHMRTHTGEKPYNCNICAKTFSASSNFHRHMRAHTEDKSYSCNICDKIFLCKSHLQEHMRTHTG